MSKILLVYGSTTGNTAAVAEALGEQFRQAGHDVEVADAANVTPDGLCAGRDAVLFGCSAWGTDEVELQADFEPLFESFDRIGARGVKVACFATGDSTFEHFCGAVDVIEARLAELGAVQLLEGLKLDGELSSNQSEVEAWGKRLLAELAR
ncbi:MAG TPA: flavodoxin [Candidatus Avidesulfovibrio excrementigallinarum]|nr:flavodoxin [Candidatus Avidesulfovibrio excrementigallinarum]